MILAYALIALVVMGLYAGHVWYGAWVYEDPRSFVTALTLSLAPRTVARASMALTPTATTAHAMNVVLHLAVIGLMGWVGRRLGLSRWAAGGLMCAIAVHRLSVQTVAYVAGGRTELIAAIGILFAVGCAAGRWWRPWAIVGMAAGATIALGGKESAVVLGLVLPVTWVLSDEAPGNSAWGYGLTGLWLAIVIVLIHTGWGLDVADIGQSGPHPAAWLPWLLIQSTAAVRLLMAVIFPLPLTVDYDYDAIGMGFRWAALGLLTLAAGITAWLWTRRPLIAYGLTLALVSLLPRLVIQTPRSYLNEHQFYVPLIGSLFAAAAHWDSRQTT